MEWGLKMTKAELIKALEKSQKTRKQIFGSLINIDFFKGGEKFVGYCALGALACEKSLFKDFGRKVLQPEYDDIIEAYGMRNYIGDKHSDYPPCSMCGKSLDYKISAIITHLNDVHKLTFKQIANHLKKVKMEKLKKRND